MSPEDTRQSPGNRLVGLVQLAFLLGVGMVLIWILFGIWMFINQISVSLIGPMGSHVLFIIVVLFSWHYVSKIFFFTQASGPEQCWCEDCQAKYRKF